MYWSAALQLRAGGAPPKRASYGSFSRTSSSGSLQIPPSIPEHQTVSQFASPGFKLSPGTLAAATATATAPATTTKLTPKLLQLNELQFSRGKLPPAAASRQRAGEQALLLPARAAADDASVTYCSSGGEEPNPQEHELEAEEHNYWMLERERRRLGLQRSRRRTCTPLTERPTTSALKVGFVMCSVPLALVLVFVVVVLALGHGAADGPHALLDAAWHARQWSDGLGRLDAFPRASWSLRGAGAGAGA